jgi:hypothetical protein
LSGASRGAPVFYQVRGREYLLVSSSAPNNLPSYRPRGWIAFALSPQ